jgi:hypothetical protein
MVGIYKKAKQLFQLISKYAPLLNNIVPGLGEVVGIGSQIADKAADGFNSIHNDYTAAKKSGEKYGFGQGIKSFFKPMVDPKRGGFQSPPKKSVANTLSKEYGGLHPRLALKQPSDESDESVDEHFAN